MSTVYYTYEDCRHAENFARLCEVMHIHQLKCRAA